MIVKIFPGPPNFPTVYAQACFLRILFVVLDKCSQYSESCAGNRILTFLGLIDIASM